MSENPITTPSTIRQNRIRVDKHFSTKFLKSIALPSGIAYDLLVNPDPVNLLQDKKFWFQIRSMMLSFLKMNIFAIMS